MVKVAMAMRDIRVMVVFLCGLLSLSGAWATSKGSVAGGTIAGSVTRAADGTPVEGVLIEIFEFGDFIPFDVGTSDGAGEFSFSGLEDGQYLLLSRGGPGFDLIDEVFDGIYCPDECRIASGRALEVSAIEGARADFTLDAGASIAGRVTRASDGSGAPMLVTVSRIVDGDVFRVGAFGADADGHYRVAGLPPGDDYVVRSESEGPGTSTLITELWDGLQCGCEVADGTRISLAPGEERTGVDFVHEASELSISGRVVDSDGQPIVGLEVVAFNLAVSFFPTGINVRRAFTDETGAYSINGLTPATYVVRTSFAAIDFGFGDEFYDNLPGTTDPFDATQIPLTDASATGIDFELTQGGVISGRVSLAATGEPVEFVIVTSNDETGQIFLSFSTLASDG
ncbi:MAG: carboxypeptidase-like regulatory domain-containing protein, partial [Pseudomonadota bacterium]